MLYSNGNHEWARSRSLSIGIPELSSIRGLQAGLSNQELVALSLKNLEA